MSYNEIWALILVLVSGSFTPGPNTALSTALGMKGGLRFAFPFVASVPVGWGVMFVLSSLGVYGVLRVFPWIYWVVLAFGVFYMLFLAFRLAFSSSLPGEAVSQPEVGFFEGVMLQFSNVKGWMMTLSVVSGWVAEKPDELERVAIVLVLIVLVGFFSNFLYSVLGVSMRKFFLKGRRMLVFNLFMAFFLAFAAFWMAWQGVDFYQSFRV